MPLKIKKTVQQMVDEANGQIETLPLADAMKAHGQPGVTFIDIRDPRELWRDGTIPGAINVTPLGNPSARKRPGTARAHRSKRLTKLV